jgi:RHS repeat-associated protein
MKLSPNCHPDERKDLGFASAEPGVEIPPGVGMTTMREGGEGIARGTLFAGLRYEYDGLNVLRVDELYDNDTGGLETNDAWRAREANTHRPGSLGALLAKRVYEYPSATSGTSNGNEDYYYGHDPVGNVTVIFDSNGDEVYHFTQDAFGNELKTATLGGSDWADARGAGVTEHQTGKWMDEFTGLYYFHARWYCAEVGRWISNEFGLTHFLYNWNDPVHKYDPDGNRSVSICTRTFDQLGGLIDNAVSYWHGHCFIQIEDDEGNKTNCGIDSQSGNPHWDHEGPTWESAPSNGCNRVHHVNYDCVLKTLQRLRDYANSGILPPSPRNNDDWGSNYRALSNNCCSGVYRALAYGYEEDTPILVPGEVPVPRVRPLPEPSLPAPPGGDDSGDPCPRQSQ